MQDALLLKALRSQNDSRPPVWLMRQAGRYMPQYQAFRKNHSLFDLFHDVEKIVEITLLPVKALDVDAAILFSDILSVCDGLGIKWGFEDGRGPLLPEPVQPHTIFSKKKNAYTHIESAIRELKKELKIPLLGFAGAPFTIASYLIEGGSSKDLKKTKKWLYSDPQSFHALLNQISEETISYLKVQIEAGVDGVQLFDSWAHHLDHPSFCSFSLHYMEKILRAIPEVPVILFCRGSCFFAKELSSIKPSAISLDWSGEISIIRKELPQVALQGNLDPMILYASKKEIQKAVFRLLDSMKGDPGFIFNLGHGLLPDIPYENVQYLVDTVKNH
jgi:uroporphyrinogen decarboxylase